MKHQTSNFIPAPARSQLVQIVTRLRGCGHHLSTAAGGVLITVALLVPFVAAAEGPQQCTLDAKAKANAIRDIRAFFVSHHATATEGAFTITMKSKGAETERELQRLIEREQACCSGLKFEVEVDASILRIVVTGPVDEVERARKILPSSSLAK